MWRNKLVLFSIVLILFSCKRTNEDYEQLESFLGENYDSIALEDFKYIVLINGEGGCVNCYNSFSKGMAKNIRLNNTLFIVSSTGQDIDISAYIDNKYKENIILDQRKKIITSKIANNPRIIFLGHHKIDSIIDINLKNYKNHIDNFPNY